MAWAARKGVSVVQPQVGTDVRDCSMDMRFTLTAADVGEVSAEHKVKQPFGETQLDDYEKAWPYAAPKERATSASSSATRFRRPT